MFLFFTSIANILKLNRTIFTNIMPVFVIMLKSVHFVLRFDAIPVILGPTYGQDQTNLMKLVMNLMDNSQILARVDHTSLKADATWEEIRTLCGEAVTYHTASVCIPPSYIARARASFPHLNLCTVIGFPLGYSTTAVKVFETREAVAQGADEIDMVIDLGDVKNGDFDAVTGEIAAVREAAAGKVLKVIVETCYLTQEEKIRLCQCVTQAGADYIKTSTGFGSAGAQLEDILLFKEHLGPGVKMKAVGGIRPREAMEAFCEAGCQRIGCSAAVRLLTQE